MRVYLFIRSNLDPPMVLFLEVSIRYLHGRTYLVTKISL